VGGVKATGAERPGKMPMRVLGRTGVKVSTLTLGTAPLGQGPGTFKECQALVERSLELGINFLDTARIYRNGDKYAEEFIAPVMKRHRDGVFLASKVWADEVDKFDQTLGETFKALGVDMIDLMYIHSLGHKDMDRLLAKGGVLDYLEKKREQGAIRFIGVSGHHKPGVYNRIIETGRIDVVMVAMNFVDRHIYAFEDKVLPAAQKQNMGVAAMKVYGGVKVGPKSVWGNYDKLAPSQLPAEHHRNAVRYALGLPGVATAVIGPHTIEQLEQNVEYVKSYKPLSETERSTLLKKGKALAAAWGPRFGPVA